jgi:hypothetical protein
MMDFGPYRSAAVQPGIDCPRCAEPLRGDLFGRMTCASSCGEWWARERLEHRRLWSQLARTQPDVRSLIGVPWPEVPCPLCGTTMAVRLAGVVAFDHCAEHGVWLDRSEPEAFELAFR